MLMVTKLVHHHDSDPGLSAPRALPLNYPAPVSPFLDSSLTSVYLISLSMKWG